MADLFSGLSDRARTWLAAVGCARPGPVATPEALAAMFDPPLLAAVCAFEVRYGGVVIDATGQNIELGLGALAARNIPPERSEYADVVLVGLEIDADLLLDARGWLWGIWADDEPAELSVGVAQYLERLAALARWPWTGPLYTIYGDPRADELIRALGLTVDPLASDEVFLLAASDGYRLQAHLRGTEWQVGRLALRCRDLAAMQSAIRTCASALPGFRCTLATDHPGVVSHRVERRHTPDTAAIEAALAARSEVCLGGLRGGAVHLLDDGTLTWWAPNAAGDRFGYCLSLTDDGGTEVTYFTPWGE